MQRWYEVHFLQKKLEIFSWSEQAEREVTLVLRASCAERNYVLGNWVAALPVELGLGLTGRRSGSGSGGGQPGQQFQLVVTTSFRLAQSAGNGGESEGSP